MSSETFDLATAGRVPQFDLADRLRKSLREADLGVSEMAEYLETSRNTIGNWINGHTRPRPAELKMWALRTGVDYRWLISGATRPVADDYGPPADFTLNPDIPSGISTSTPGGYADMEHTAIVREFRKRLPLGQTAHPRIARTARS